MRSSLGVCFHGYGGTHKCKTPEEDRQEPVARSMVSANRWLTNVKTYRFPWYSMLVSANHASSNPKEEKKLKFIELRNANSKAKRKEN